ncbi:LysM peptidoglycan-binding domain-containing protein [Parahaliea mediterranea]|uniref:LysM peptidoglycan-binding domain-containing protein n=1 Tax=Parahaliea mediterranea TaxID=651086 RepID=UPI000E2E7FF4|nr:LysM peptidoglycan-binding domain-containing protein [Parahaliea mediterranea]
MALAAGCQTLAPETAGDASGQARQSAPPAVAGKPHPRSPSVVSPLPRRPTPLQPVDQDPEDLWQRLGDQLSWQIANNEQVKAARQSYLRQDSYLDVITERSSLYLYYIADQVEARGMPAEIALLPLVESTMDPFARSPNHAVGLWQIMPATGEHLGLASNWWYDGRQDVRASTQVALDYLESLQEYFDGDWLLTLAAYNSGAGRVSRAIAANEAAGKPTDYWSLPLPRETRRYVPKLLALSSIIGNPDRYGVELPPLPNDPAFVVADTGGQIELARAAELAGVDEDLLRALNPGQLRWATAPNQAHELLLPPDAAPRFEEAIAGLDSGKRVSWQHYRIQRGDSLIRIAKRFDTDVAMLRQANHLRGNLIRAGDTLLIPGGSAWPGALAGGVGGGVAGANGEPRSHDYRVRKGDSLHRIAGRFKVSIDDIISWNALNPGAYLQPGQQLTLYLSDDG